MLEERWQNVLDIKQIEYFKFEFNNFRKSIDENVVTVLTNLLFRGPPLCRELGDRILEDLSDRMPVQYAVRDSSRSNKST